MTSQRDASWVTAASPAQISAALAAGELAHYMGGQTADERNQDAVIAATPDRLYAQAHGFDSYEQMRSVVSAHGSTLVTAIRRGMSPDQLAGLDWLESATPQQAYAAEQTGELNRLLGRGQHAGENKADGIIRSAGGAASNSDIHEVEGSAEYRGMSAASR